MQWLRDSFCGPKWVWALTSIFIWAVVLKWALLLSCVHWVSSRSLAPLPVIAHRDSICPLWSNSEFTPSDLAKHFFLWFTAVWFLFQLYISALDTQEHVTWTLLQRLMYLTYLILVIFRHDGNKCLGVFFVLVWVIFFRQFVLFVSDVNCVFRTACVTVMRRWRESVGGWVERVALWCNALAGVLWNSMKAEITQTRLVEQSGTELQSQIPFLLLTHAETQAFTSFCFFLSWTLFPLPCFSKQLIFFFFLLVYIDTSSSQPRWNLLQHLDVFIHAHMFKSLCFSPFSAQSFLPAVWVCVCCFPLRLSLSPPCAQSPLKPLCSVSPLTTAVTLWPQFLRNRCAALWLDSRGRRKERKREGVGGGGGEGRRLRHWLVCGRHFVARW